MVKVSKRGRKAPPRVRRKPVAPPQRSGERYELAMRAINEGVYDWDVANRKIHYSQSVYSVLKMPRNLKTPADWRKRIHPDDRAAYEAAIVAHFKQQTKRFECDYRFRATDGTWHWARQRGIALRDPRGRAVRMIGSIGDISDLKRAEEARRQSDERYAFAMRAINEGVYDWNIAEGRTYYSERVVNALGLTQKQLRTAADWHKRIHLEDRPRFDAALVAHFKGDTERFECDYRYRARDGSWRWARQHGIAMRDARGRAVRMIGSTGDINELKLAEIALRRARDEATEALEQQKASGEVLGAIGSSIADTAPVFEKILESCERLFAGRIVGLNLVGDDGMLHIGAYHGAHRKEFERIFPIPLTRDSGSGLSIMERRVVHYPDAQHGEEVPERTRQGCKTIGIKSTIFAPMLWEGRGVGAIFVGRDYVSTFSGKEIALLRTFADQAAIAIENVRLFNETKEALERQTATAEILNVIAGSPSDVQPVFDAILARAPALCGASFGNVFRYDGTVLEIVAANLSSSSMDILRREYPAPPSRDKVSGRVVLDRQIVEIPDVQGDADYRGTAPKASGIRSLLGVPLLREGQPIGAIVIGRLEPGKFPPRQAEMAQTFADQAVIAIENVRLFNETKEALERQTATAEILKVIASSPSDVQPVFDAIVRSGLELFGGMSVALFLARGDQIDRVAFRLAADAQDEAKEFFPAPLSDASISGRVILSGQAANVADVTTDPAVGDRSRRLAERMGFRSVLVVPLLREGRAIGTIAVFRRQAERFSDRQTSVLQTFADQAVIAIENVRLFNETQEALARQAAAAQVLRAISESVSDTAPVFTAILDCCNRLIPSVDYVQVQLIEGSDRVRLVDHRFGQVRGAAPGKQDERRAELMAREAAHFPRPLAGSTLERALNQGRVVILADTLDGPDTPPATLVDARRWGHSYSQINVPLMREGRCIGAIEAFRRQLGGFEAKESSLLESFANQAVIAIENVRLFKELQQRIGQMTSLREVGQAIGSSLDLETVLKTIVSHAVKLTGLDAGGVYEYDEALEEFRLRASEGMSGEIEETLREKPIRKGEGAVGGTAVTREPVQVADIQVEGYDSRLREILVRSGRRAVLAVPLLREDHIVGALAVQKAAAGPFAPEVVELLKTFATQSAMAIQNARLYREIAEKGRQLEVASQHKSQFLASMSHELRTPLNAILGFNEMILDQVYGEISPEVKSPLENMQQSGKHLLRLINNVLDLAKIEAGRMELALSDYSVQDTVASVHSTLKPLAAEKGLEFTADAPPDIPLAYGDAGRIAQCLMNLAGNSLKFTKAGKVEITVAQKDDRLRYSVADTGIGIPPDKIASLFTEFKQTDATIASEYGGTGLGLSISKKFIEMHGGRIWVESELGKGSAFIFEIPLRAKSS